MITRRDFLAAAVATAAAPAVRTQPRRRNALLIIADDQGLDLGCYGNGAIKTPNIDELAASAVRFSHGFSTVASCSPSRSVLLTGLFTHTNGQYGLAHAIHNQRTLADVSPLSALLKAAGYATGVVGKLHVTPEPLYAFEYHVEGPAIAGNRDVEAMARKAGEFIRATGERPFFLVVGYSDPHRTQQGFANTRSYAGVADRAYDPASVRVPYHLPDWPEVRQDLADYYRAVSRLDAGVGLLMRELAASGRAKDTLIIYVSDNGIPFPGAKTTLYDAGIHLPLIVASPDLARRGTITDAMASWIDVTPTILDWAGVRGPSAYALPGRSLLPVLGDAQARGWDRVFASHTFHEITMYYPMRALRTRRHKYLLNVAHQLPYPQASDILDSPSWRQIAARRPEKMGERVVATYFQRPAEELYDLDRDPNELQNVAADPAYAATLADLRQQMLAFRQDTRDPWLVKHGPGHSHDD